MQFNSLEFVIFLPIVFLIYWFIANRHLKYQNLFLLCSSYLFYGWWDFKFLFLIIFSSFIDFWIGLKLLSTSKENRRKQLLFLSIIVNIGLLGFFKYYNFFIDSFIRAFSFFGERMDLSRLNIILPIGISFYTFQTLSYTIDIYRKKLTPTADIIAFFGFVSFFPQLVAGPIERASNLLPQFLQKRSFDYSNAVEGMRQILWGLFKKIVIGDNCAVFANMIFNNANDYTGSELVLGALFFTFQIYCDFSGYSDIAIGTSRLFGFNLMQNFKFPYFSRDIAEFWRRWHISLSTWFRDYLYIPLGGSRRGVFRTVRNIFIIFIVSGFWHGANWTFIVWGALNAFYILPLMLTNTNRLNMDIVAKGKNLPSLKDFLNMALTFSLTVLAWIFFRAETVEQAFSYISTIFSTSIFTIPHFIKTRYGIKIILLVIIFISIEWFGREKEHVLANLNLKWSKKFRLLFYYLIITAIFWLGGEEQQFIYFQF